MLPPEIGSSTQKERENYIQTAFRCKSDCDNCGMCKVFHGKTPEVVYADYIAGKKTFGEISAEYR